MLVQISRQDHKTSWNNNENDDDDDDDDDIYISFYLDILPSLVTNNVQK